MCTRLGIKANYDPHYSVLYWPYVTDFRDSREYIR